MCIFAKEITQTFYLDEETIAFIITLDHYRMA